MLKALELVGFKSFADRTRFEFPPGITAVVGPNGSGKSNVVDGIRWVLGEQSAKSLRGKEMADCIFNGSGTRVPMNFAETTLTFDNTNRLLSVDSDEVHVTRRVYRSGEGEYLINRQPCRLRDIRDLFAGTGIATEAYSIIEQGKVDVLLQSSPRDRRLIFEEAAGISRFKAKKIESLRRLERVEQNLLRLADIVDEVQNQLRNVRKQAAKAERYKQLADRLQGLRTQVGHADWRQLGERLDAFEQELRSLADQHASHVAEGESLDQQIAAAETQYGEIQESLQTCEAHNAENREQIAAAEAAIDHERTRLADVEEEIDRLRRQTTSMTLRAGDLQHQLAETDQSIDQAKQKNHGVLKSLGDEERQLTELTSQLDACRAESDRHQSSHRKALAHSVDLGRQSSALDSQVATVAATKERLEQRVRELAQSREKLDAQLASIKADGEARRQQLEEAQIEHLASEEELARLRGEHAAAAENTQSLRQRLAVASERALVLEELEQRLEGLGAGVKEVLVRAQAAQQGPFREVRGLVADALRAEMEYAPLIDLALGETAQYVLLRGGEQFMRYLVEQPHPLSGRVGLLVLDNGSETAASADLTGRPGVVARADALVQAPAEYADLPARLLGRTWVVESLPVALELAAQSPGQRFVTTTGEVLAADGSLSIGPRQAGLGLISRRSELRALREEIQRRRVELAAAEKTQNQLAATIEGQRTLVERQEAAVARQQEEVAQLRLSARALEARETQLAEQATGLGGELAATVAQYTAAHQGRERIRQNQRQADESLRELELQLAEMAKRTASLEGDRYRVERGANELKIELAKSDERLGNLAEQRRQLERDQHERVRTLSDVQSQWMASDGRAMQARFAILETESRLAEIYLRKEAFLQETVRLLEQRDAVRVHKAERIADAQRLRTRIRQVEEQIHQRELAANEVRLQRDALVVRMRDDYGIELGEIEHEPTAEELRERAEIDQEIAELRRKVSNIGSVNLDALDELADLETRYTSLAAQLADLTSAKNSLEQIIHKINADSRRLFQTTFDTVRGHFQELFRKLFGGGQADVVLEEGQDILDCGIEIVAHPPGKEPRSISLLSGGEKTLTCVALLLAIFRSRPSPFCILDEVDAALDEANIERFSGVLREFLAWTQFVIITHSKKTMTCANTLYGVTMQESGVSKRVSVRFEDVSDTGEFRVDVTASQPADEDRSDDTRAA